MWAGAAGGTIPSVPLPPSPTSPSPTTEGRAEPWSTTSSPSSAAPSPTTPRPEADVTARDTPSVATRVTSTRLVGRSGEVAQLEGALADAAAARPSLAFVAGESGVGKSRLVAELEDRARTLGAHVLHGETIELGEGELPYGPLVGALRALARDGADVLDDLGPGVRAELARLLPAIGPGEDPSLLGADPRAPRRGCSRRSSSSSRAWARTSPSSSSSRTSTGPTRRPGPSSPSWPAACATSASWSSRRTASTSSTGATRCARCWRSSSATPTSRASSSRR